MLPWGRYAHWQNQEYLTLKNIRSSLSDPKFSVLASENLNDHQIIKG